MYIKTSKAENFVLIVCPYVWLMAQFVIR